MVTDRLTRTSTPDCHQPLLIAREIAPLLKVSVGQVYRLARANRIPAHHFGASVRFNVDEVLAATATLPRPVHQPRTAATTLALARLQLAARTSRNPHRTNRVVLTDGGDCR